MKDELTRRETLKRVTAASGGFVLGMSTVGTVTAKRNPGSAFVELGYEINEGDTFTIDRDEDSTVPLSPSCKAGPPPQEYEVFEVSGMGPPQIAVNPNRGVTAGPTVYEVTSVRDDCEDVYESGVRFAFRPV
jgi:hypothetical protein